MHQLIVSEGPGAGREAITLTSDSHSIRLSDGSLSVEEGLVPGEILLLFRRGQYVFCGNASPGGVLNRDPGGQRNLIDGDELQIGPYRLRYTTDESLVLQGARACGFDWFRAILCSLALLLALLFLLRDFGGGGGGGVAEAGGLGGTESGEGVGGDSGNGGGGDLSGSGSGNGGTGMEQTGADAPPAETVAGGQVAPQPGETESAVPPPAVPEEPSPATEVTEEKVAESILPPPPAPDSKIASFSVAPTAPPPVSAGGLIGGPGRGAVSLQGVSDIVQGYPDSHVTINIDATGSMESARDAIANLLPELLGEIKGGSVSVNFFRDLVNGERNEFVVPPTRGTRNPDVASELIEKVKRVTPGGGGDGPETGYQIVIHNMKKDMAGFKERPNIQFIVTDAPEKQPELEKEMISLAARTNTLIFHIDVSARPPVRKQLR